MRGELGIAQGWLCYPDCQPRLLLALPPLPFSGMLISDAHFLNVKFEAFTGLLCSLDGDIAVTVVL